MAYMYLLYKTSCVVILMSLKTMQPFFSAAVIVDEHTTSFLTLAISLAVGGVVVILVVIAIVIGAIVYYKK